MRRAEEEAAMRRAEEAAAMRRAEEAAAMRRAEEAAAMRRAEEAEAMRRAQEAEAMRRAQEAAAMRRAQEAAAMRRAQEAAAMRRAQEAAAVRRAEEAAAMRRAREAAVAAAIVVKTPPDEEMKKVDEEDEEDEEEEECGKLVFGPAVDPELNLRRVLNKAHLTTEELSEAGIFKCYLLKTKKVKEFKFYIFPKENGKQEQVLVPELRDVSIPKKPFWWIDNSYYLVPELLRKVLCPADGVAKIPEVNRDIFLEAQNAVDFLEKHPLPNRQPIDRAKISALMKHSRNKNREELEEDEGDLKRPRVADENKEN